MMIHTISGRERYGQYLKSKHWADLKYRVLVRDGYACVKCGARMWLQPHHKFYRSRWEDSQPEDLITLCDSCHRKEHKLPPRPKKVRRYRGRGAYRKAKRSVWIRKRRTWSF